MEQEDWLERAEQIIRGNDYAHLNLNFDELQRALSHVYWIGGSGCAGKSTIAKKLAAQYHLAIYHCDDHLRTQRARVEAEQLPLPIMAGPCVPTLDETIRLGELVSNQQGEGAMK